MVMNYATLNSQRFLNRYRDCVHIMFVINVTYKYF